MHTSVFYIPKSQTKLRGVEHTRRRQMFVPICKAKYKLKLLPEGMHPVRMDCVLVLKEKSKKFVRLITTAIKCWVSFHYSVNVNENLKEN